MSARGTLELPAALLQLHDAGANGVVRFERGNAKKQLVLRRGRVAFAESNQADEHLVRIMMRLRTLSPAALSPIAAGMKKGLTTDAAIAAGAGADAEAVLAGAREQAIGIVASLLGWTDVVIRYYAGHDLLKRKFDAGMEIPVLLAAAARRAASSRTATTSVCGAVVLDETSLRLAAKMPLEPAETYACSLCRQPVPVGDFLNLMPLGQTDPKEVLLRLMLLGLVRTSAAQPEQHGETDADMEELLRRFEIADHYEVLSLPADAGQDAIKAAYHAMARRYHPDLFQADRFSAGLRQKAAKLFTYFTAAYTTLNDPAARAAYDEQRAGSKLKSAVQARGGAQVDNEKAAMALFRVGQQALLDKELDKAIATLGECVFLRPEVAIYRRALGCAQAQLPRHHKEAEQNLLKAIELDPMSLESYMALGRLYMKVHLSRRAEAQFRRVLQWDPENAEANRCLNEVMNAPS